MNICFIGHRKIGFGPIRDRLVSAIEEEIKNSGDCFKVGTHGEFDTMALSCLREARRIHSDIKIEVVLTSLKKAEKQLLYDDEFGKEYYEPYKDVETVVYEIEEEHFKRQIIISNQKMIDECDVLICYVNKKRNPSGAKLAMNYAKRKGLKIINLYKESDKPTYGMTEEQKQEYYVNFSKQLKDFLNKKIKKTVTTLFTF